MATWLEDNVPKYMPLIGYQIPYSKIWNYKQAGDANPVQNTPSDINGHDVKAFVQSTDFFDDVHLTMNKLIAEGRGIFWIHGWYFQLFAHETIMNFYGQEEMPANLHDWESNATWEVTHKDKDLKFTIVPNLFADKLEEMSRAGIDVRIIGWISPWVLKSERVKDLASGFSERNFATFHSLLKLRTNGHIPEEKIIFNTVTHPIGGAHAKFIIAGCDSWRKMYTSGLDAAPSRNKRDWKDAGIVVQGKATTHGAKFFVQLWNEISRTTPINIRTFQTATSGTPTPAVHIPDAQYPTHFSKQLVATIADIAAPTGSDKAVQLYRTLPTKKYMYGFFRHGFVNFGTGTTTAFTSGTTFKHDSLSRSQVEALEQLPGLFSDPLETAPNGLFEFKTCCYKAIAAAERYIFIIDQDASNFELAGLINRRLKECPTLKVIIATQVYETAMKSIRPRVKIETPSSHRDQAIQMYNRIVSKLKGSLADNVVFVNYISHAKIMLIDDKWASIGSANCMRRSFYTDIEMGVAVMHETWVRNFRKEVFLTMTNTTVPIPEDMDEALGMFSKAWQEQVTHTYNCPKLAKCTTVVPKSRYRYGPSFGSFQRRSSDPDSNSYI